MLRLRPRVAVHQNCFRSNGSYQSWRPLSSGTALQQSALDILEQRGLIKDVAGDRNELNRRLLEQPTAAYSGIDPTASSLHLGHLLPLNVLFWLYSCGHTAVSLVGIGSHVARTNQLSLTAWRCDCSHRRPDRQATGAQRAGDGSAAPKHHEHGVTAAQSMGTHGRDDARAGPGS